MALWGNKDNIDSSGTVTVNYADLKVTGTGTTFGGVGCAKTGDVIRFGQAFGGRDGYSGDAVIVSIASTLECTIDGTSGLSGAEIFSSAYQINQCPKFHTKDAAANQRSASDATRGRLYTGVTTAAVAIGSTIITVSGSPQLSVAANDHVVVKHGIDGREQMGTVFSAASEKIILVNAVPRVTFHYRIRPGVGILGVGTRIVEVEEAIINGIKHPLTDIIPGDTFHHGTNSIGIGTVIIPQVIGAEPFAQLTLNAAGLTQAIVKVPVFGSPAEVRRGIANGSTIIVRGKETVGSVETQVVGVSTGGSRAAQSTQFETGVGWVGVSTYMASDGAGGQVLRVKKEILVAMSGIQTGNAPIYDGNPFA